MNYKVVVADDDPYILMSLEFLMKKKNYSVFIARDGEEALHLIEREIPQVAILDIMMPKLDGYQLCQHIKSNAQIANCKVVFLSAKTSQEDIEKGYRMGAQLYIAKPFSTKELLERIDEFMQSNESFT